MKNSKANYKEPTVIKKIKLEEKSINIFAQFEVTTQIIGWDQKYFYIKHEFFCKNSSCAVALVKACFLRRGHKILAPQEVIKILGRSEQSPELPIWISEWDKVEKN